MNKLKISSVLSSAVLAIALGSNAGATTVTVGNATMVAGEGMMSAQAGAITTTFDGMSQLPSGFTAIGTNPSNPLVSGSSLHTFLAPTGDNSTYVSTGSGVVLDQMLPKDTNYYGFYWGSLDTYNVFSITDSNGNTFSISGATLASDFNIAADGNSSYFVNFFAAPGATFTAAGFGSGINAFEFDNVATATPEPGTVAMLAGGLLILVGTVRRRKAQKA